MRVNISYSVDFDEVPSKVSSFMEGCAAQLSDSDICLEEIAKSIQTGRHGQALKEIARFRDTLASVDFRLDDCMTIINGKLFGFIICYYSTLRCYKKLSLSNNAV